MSAVRACVMRCWGGAEYLLTCCNRCVFGFFLAIFRVFYNILSNLRFMLYFLAFMLFFFLLQCFWPSIAVFLVKVAIPVLNVVILILNFALNLIITLYRILSFIWNVFVPFIGFIIYFLIVILVAIFQAIWEILGQLDLMELVWALLEVILLIVELFLNILIVLVQIGAEVLAILVAVITPILEVIFAVIEILLSIVIWVVGALFNLLEPVLEAVVALVGGILSIFGGRRRLLSLDELDMTGGGGAMGSGRSAAFVEDLYAREMRLKSSGGLEPMMHNFRGIVSMVSPRMAYLNQIQEDWNEQYADHGGHIRDSGREARNWAARNVMPASTVLRDALNAGIAGDEEEEAAEGLGAEGETEDGKRWGPRPRRLHRIDPWAIHRTLGELKHGPLDIDDGGTRELNILPWSRDDGRGETEDISSQAGGGRRASFSDGFDFYASAAREVGMDIGRNGSSPAPRPTEDGRKRRVKRSPAEEEEKEPEPEAYRPPTKAENVRRATAYLKRTQRTLDRSLDILMHAYEVGAAAGLGALWAAVEAHYDPEHVEDHARRAAWAMGVEERHRVERDPEDPGKLVTRVETTRDRVMEIVSDASEEARATLWETAEPWLMLESPDAWTLALSPEGYSWHGVLAHFDQDKHRRRFWHDHHRHHGREPPDPWSREFVHAQRVEREDRKLAKACRRAEARGRNVTAGNVECARVTSLVKGGRGRSGRGLKEQEFKTVATTDCFTSDPRNPLCLPEIPGNFTVRIPPLVLPFNITGNETDGPGGLCRFYQDAACCVLCPARIWNAFTAIRMLIISNPIALIFLATAEAVMPWLAWLTKAILLVPPDEEVTLLDFICVILHVYDVLIVVFLGLLFYWLLWPFVVWLRRCIRHWVQAVADARAAEQKHRDRAKDSRELDERLARYMYDSQMNDGRRSGRGDRGGRMRRTYWAGTSGRMIPVNYGDEEEGGAGGERGPDGMPRPRPREEREEEERERRDEISSTMASKHYEEIEADFDRRTATTTTKKAEARIGDGLGREEREEYEFRQALEASRGARGGGGPVEYLRIAEEIETRRYAASMRVVMGSLRTSVGTRMDNFGSETRMSMTVDEHSDLMAATDPNEDRSLSLFDFRGWRNSVYHRQQARERFRDKYFPPPDTFQWGLP